MAMFWKARNGTLTALQSLSPPVIASSSPSRRPFPHQCTTHAQPQVSASAPPQAKVQAPPTRVVENLMHKNDLNRYCQKLGIPLPVYQTAVEGFAHALRFRSTVSVGQRRFTSQNTFANRKSAEQDVAKLALEHLPNEDEAWSTPDREYLRKLVCRDKARCKMIINEFTAKIKMECAYKTVQVEVVPPLFTCSLVLNGTCYKSECGKNKKEAEQLAALGAICSLLDDSTYSTTISKVIKSKINLGASFECNNNIEEQQGVSRTLPQKEKQDGDGVSPGLGTGVATISRCSYLVWPVTSPLLFSAAQRFGFVSPATPDAAYDLTSSKKQRKN